MIRNFSELIKSKNIVIPIIQRDYAQGRVDEAIDSIRKTFIIDLFRAVDKNDNEKMDLQYIYGTEKSGDVFLPIDGQQRLTSTYLFLWFCVIKGGKGELFCKEIKSFSYQVRQSAENFFDALQKKDENNGLTYIKDFEQYVNNELELIDCSWFRTGWLNDPTVMGAINFLDEIRNRAEDYRDNLDDTEKFGAYTEKLLDNEKCPIELIYMAQNEVNMGDLSDAEKEKVAFEAENRAAITYINMNARGKVLNDFENLKALINKTGESKHKASDFVQQYDKEYINWFFKEVERKAGNLQLQLSLAQKVEKMDQLTSDFLRNLYIDMRMLEGSTEKDFTHNKFMDRLRDNPSYPSEYFEFIKNILCNYNDYDVPEKDVFYDYCNNNTRKLRFSFFSCFWEKYRGVNKDNYWSKYLKKRLEIENWKDEIKDAETLEAFMIGLKKLIDQIGERDPLDVLNFLKDSNPEDLYKSITENNEKKFDNILDRATLIEEKIKAKIILNDNIDNNQPLSRDKKITRIDNMGKTQNNKMRYLLYISGLWKDEIIDNTKDDSTINWQECWESLVKYSDMDKKYFSKPSEHDFEWKKLFYLSALKLDSTYQDENLFEYLLQNGITSLKTIIENGNVQLPELRAETVWYDNSELQWKGRTIEPKQKERLERVKRCFDMISKYSTFLCDIKDAVGNNRKNWLYYLLNKDYSELLQSNIIQEKNGTYLIDGRNYCEYVLELDTSKAEIGKWTHNDDDDDPESIRGIEHREGDGFYKARNVEASLKFKICIKDDSDKEWLYICNKSNIIRYRFESFQKDTDYFSTQKDAKSFEEYESCVKVLKKDIKGQIHSFSDDDLYNIIFKEEFGKLEEMCAALKERYGREYPDFNLEFESRKWKANTIVVEVSMSKDFKADSPEVVSHDEFVDKYK